MPIYEDARWLVGHAHRQGLHSHPPELSQANALSIERPLGPGSNEQRFVSSCDEVTQLEPQPLRARL
jgi:hypothetical protein